MIRLYTVTINIGDRDPDTVTGIITGRLERVAKKHPAMRGCTITKATAGTVEATLRVSGVHQWDASANARSIATAILLRTGIPVTQATMIPQPAPPDGRTLKKQKTTSPASADTTPPALGP